MNPCFDLYVNVKLKSGSVNDEINDSMEKKGRYPGTG